MPSERVQRRIDRLLDEAEAAADNGDWRAVRDSAQRVLAVDHDNRDAHSFIAMAGKGATEADSPGGAASIAPAADSDAPTSFADGRYSVTRLLGEGGKKKVYLAHDSTLDRDVAFAVIKTEGLDDIGRERVRREAQAMGRMGTHPCIMPIYDLGEEDGQPFMVQPLMGGGDVEELIQDADGPLPLERALQIATQTAQGLVFAHSKGIIHRDLKPGNIWLDDDGNAKIGDFGLAISTDRSRLTVEKLMVGTVNYMPPEQATGGEITPRADLYSLGAMLYEMVTGRPPFLGDDDIAIIGQHINTPPVAPTWHNGDCPRPLEALIMRMLAKDPSERPDGAQDVLNALDAIDLTARGETVEREANSLESLAGGVFVGRQAEMDQLKAALEDVLGGRGRLVTLVGEPGIGKTRTSEELATYAGLRGAQVLWGRCYEGGGAPPYWPWVQAIRSYVRNIDPDELRRQMGSTASVVAEIVTDVKDRLPELQPPPQIDDPESARFRLFDSITSFLRTASQAQPLVIVLDDLHWSDQPSLAFLEFIARELNQSRVMLLCTYRDVELNRRHQLTVTLGDLARDRLYERVLLRGLTETDIARFVEIAAGFAAPRELSATVHRHTEGNPLFVTEVVRDLVQSGELTEEKIAGRSTWSVRIPEGVREVIGRRLDRLSDRANEIFTTASVIGRDFTLDALRALAEDTTEGQLLDVVDEGLYAKIIEELPDALGHYQFTHALVQETLSDELSTTRRVRLHARIAETLEELYGDGADDHAEELVAHFAEAETVLGTDGLVRYSIAAAEAATAAYGFEDVVTYTEPALAAFADSPITEETARLHLLAARAHGALRHVDEALASANLAFDYFEAAGNGERCAEIARFPFTPSSLRMAIIPLQERALRLVPEDSAVAARILLIKGASEVIVRDWEDANRTLEQAELLVRRLGEPVLLVELATARTTLGFFGYAPQAIIDAATEAGPLFEQVDAPMAESWIRGHRAGIHAGAGEREQAYGELEKAHDVAARAGDHQRIQMVYLIDVSAATFFGDWDRAREAYERGSQAWQGGFIGPAYALTASMRGEQEKALGLVDEYVAGADDRTMEEFATVRIAAMNLPVIARMTGEPRVLDALRLAVSNIEAQKVGPLDWPIHVFAAGWLAVLNGDRRAARELLPRAISAGETTSGHVLHSVLWSLSGPLARVAELSEKAVQEYERSIGWYEERGHRPFATWMRVEYSEFLLEQDDTGPSGKATELQDEAIAIATELGMKPLLERVLSQRKILKA